MYYVYLLMDPRTDQPFYVGKGKEGSNRHTHHFHETETTTINKHKFYKIRYLISTGHQIPTVVVKDGLTEEQAYLLETSLIQQYGRENIDSGGILTNICLHAQPPSMKGKRRDRDGVERMVKSRQGKCFLTAELKQQISNKLKGHRQSEDTKRKRADSLAKNPKSYGRKKWMFVHPDGTCYVIEKKTRNEFCAEHNIAISRSFYKWLNTGQPCEAVGNRAKNAGWMFWDDEMKMAEYIDCNGIIPIKL